MTALAAGDQIGSYRILAKIGRAGRNRPGRPTRADDHRDKDVVTPRGPRARPRLGVARTHRRHLVSQMQRSERSPTQRRG